MRSKWAWLLVGVALLAGPLAWSAEFKARDAKTAGKWKGTYGKTAAWIAISSDTDAKQAGYKLEVKDDQTYTWSEDSADDKRTPQPVKDGDKTAATCWYADDAFSLTVTPPEVTTPEQRRYRVTVYVMDWDHQGRAQEAKVDGIDQAQPISAAECDGGLYLTWLADKAFTLHMSKTDGPNAVISAVFVDPAD
jgi:hypothetical protein